MKVLIFSGGLGNQLFCYVFYQYLKGIISNEKIYGFFPKSMMNEHYGLEIAKWFDVELPKENIVSKFVVGLVYLQKKILKIDFLIDFNQRKFKNEKALVIFAFKQTNEYFNNIQIKFKINKESLYASNREILTIIENTDSYFVHIRRGDYLSPQYKSKYEGTCNKYYYSMAIENIRKKRNCPIFFVFSDDIEWSKNNIDFKDGKVYYINWNFNEQSPLDMFLMSQCKGGIIANSTFSFWGAYLGIKKQIVIYPLEWEHTPQGAPSIFPTEWQGL